MHRTLVLLCMLVMPSAERAASPADSIDVAARSRSLQPGEVIVLTLTTPSPADGVDVHVFDRNIQAFQIDARTWQALVGIDLAASPGAYTSTIEGRSGPNHLRGAYRFTVQAKKFPTRVLKVDPDFVNPPSAMEDRIVREAAELSRILNQVSTTRIWDGVFVAPVTATATSAFGSRSIFNGVARNPHSGADFPSATGTPIAAPSAGRVVLARDLYFSGNTVILDHGLGLLSLLAHMSVVDVREGDLVPLGKVVGKVGATGRVTGPHLHWAVRLNGARVDPVAVLALLGRPEPLP